MKRLRDRYEWELPYIQDRNAAEPYHMRAYWTINYIRCAVPRPVDYSERRRHWLKGI
jgi:hypothetical protein